MGMSHGSAPRHAEQPPPHMHAPPPHAHDGPPGAMPYMGGPPGHPMGHGPAATFPVQAVLSIPDTVQDLVRWAPFLLTTAMAVLNHPCPWDRAAPHPVERAPAVTAAQRDP